MPAKPNLSTPQPSEEDYDRSLGRRFGREAELYDALRPGYYDGLFTALAETTGLNADSRVLEIGAGTGQATVPMAERGYVITAAELSEELARLAIQKLQPYPNAEVITGNFEDMELPDASFDLVYSATAIHWIRPEVRFAKPHRLLKPGGFLAIITNHPVSDEKGDEFAHSSRPIFERYGINRMDNLTRTVDELPVFETGTDLFEAVSFFVTKPAIIWRYDSAQEYADSLRTLSFILALPEAEREALLGEIQELIKTKFNDKLDVPYSSTLQIDRKK